MEGWQVRDVDKEAAEARRARRIGEFIDGLGSGAGVRGLANGVLVGVKIRFPTEEDPSTLLSIRALDGDEALIGFVGAYCLGDAVLAWWARIHRGSMKWREDLPWNERV